MPVRTGERNWVAVKRFCSGNGEVPPLPPMLNGLRLMAGIVGEPAARLDNPWRRTVTPWGIEAKRATVAETAGLVVDGMLSQTPGSRCRPLPGAARLASLICCR